MRDRASCAAPVVSGVFVHLPALDRCTASLRTEPCPFRLTQLASQIPPRPSVVASPGNSLPGTGTLAQPPSGVFRSSVPTGPELPVTHTSRRRSFPQRYRTRSQTPAHGMKSGHPLVHRLA